MAEKEVLFSVQHLKKYFQVGKNATLKAVDDVSFEIYKGETLGMVGESAAERRPAAVPVSVCMIKQTERYCIKEKTFTR